jgi:hypothetical protein
MLAGLWLTLGGKVMGVDLATVKELADTWSIYLMLPVMFVHIAAGLVGFSEWRSGGWPPKAPKSFVLFRLAALGFAVLTALMFIADKNWFLWLCLAFMNVMVVNSKKKQLEKIYENAIQMPRMDKPI